MQESKHPPKKLQGILWSCSVSKLDLKKDKVYIINQALSYGTLSHIQWLYSSYGSEEITQVFIDNPIKDYTASRFLFVKNFLLKLSDLSLDEMSYVANTPRNIR